MEQSTFCEANKLGSLDDIEIPLLLWNPKVHYRIHKNPTVAPIQSQINPVHTLISYISKFYFNIILSSCKEKCTLYKVYTSQRFVIFI
jgi:hypothetical protein